MDSTHAIGFVLTGISAALLASHWQQTRADAARPKPGNRWREYARRRLLRRTVASSLVGIVGLALLAFDQVPRTPLSITCYLLALVLATCWIMWLGLMDLRATRTFQEGEELDRIAGEVRRARLPRSADEFREMCDGDR